jgi:hypothetical protein
MNGMQASFRSRLSFGNARCLSFPALARQYKRAFVSCTRSVMDPLRGSATLTLLENVPLRGPAALASFGNARCLSFPALARQCDHFVVPLPSLRLEMNFKDLH